MLVKDIINIMDLGDLYQVFCKDGTYSTVTTRGGSEEVIPYPDQEVFSLTAKTVVASWDIPKSIIEIWCREPTE